jgi:phenylpyruvate tautomerase PptA (4-oxalocrotonate tautomerase family)
VPLLDVTIPEGALAPDAEDALLAELTDVLLREEGADPSNPVARSIAWVYLHRPAKVFVAGAPAEKPVYRATASAPEGQWDDERRSSLVKAVTEAILRAEGTTDPTPADLGRVWVFPYDVPDGTWGGAGQIARLRDIAGLVMGDADKAAAYADRRIAKSREARAAVPSPA